MESNRCLCRNGCIYRKESNLSSAWLQTTYNVFNGKENTSNIVHLPMLNERTSKFPSKRAVTFNWCASASIANFLIFKFSQTLGFNSLVQSPYVAFNPIHILDTGDDCDSNWSLSLLRRLKSQFVYRTWWVLEARIQMQLLQSVTSCFLIFRKPNKKDIFPRHVNRLRESRCDVVPYLLLRSKHYMPIIQNSERFALW